LERTGEGFMTNCPRDDQLERLLEGALDEDDLAVVVAHLEACARCRGVLEELTRDRLSLIGWRPAEVRIGGDEGGDPADQDTTDHFSLTDFDAERLPRRGRAGDGPRAAPSDPPRRWRHSPLGATVRPIEVGWPDLEGYEILASLGYGGMGVVYKARQRSLNRPVALKMVRAGELARPEQLDRFRFEAEAAARLRHPNIVQIYDVGERDGLPFFALELLEGGSLEARLAGKPQPERQAAELATTLAGAVHAAHRAGIVHRDLKPSNVLFAGDGTPKITDFGLAKRLDDDDGHTRTGQVMGSPGFMAPEQARGRTREVGAAADIYSLGAILYQMLTGRPPFHGASPMETMLQVIHDEPVPPSRLRPKLSRDLETICLRCLAKEPGRRYPTAAALAEDLDRFLAGAPIRARPTSSRERLVKWARREPAAASLAVVVAAVAVGLVGAGLRAMSLQRREEARIAALRLKETNSLFEGREAVQRGRWADGKLRLAMLAARLEAEPRLADLRSAAEALMGEADRRLADERARAAALDRYRHFLDRKDRALYHDLRPTGLDSAAKVEATRAAALAALGFFAGGAPPALSPQERAEVDEGRYELTLILAEATARPLPGEEARRQAVAAIAILDRAAGMRPPGRAYHLRRAACLAASGDAAAADRERREAERHRPASPFDHFLSGQAQYQRGDWGSARQHFEAALGLRPDLFWADVGLALCDLHAGRPAQARAILTPCLGRRPGAVWLYLLRGFAAGEEAHLIRRRIAARPALAGTLEAQATALFESAEADYRAAMDLEPAADDRYALLVNRGTLRVRRGRPEAAVADFRQAIRLRPDLVMGYAGLAQAYQQQGRPGQAVAQFGRALELRPDLAPLYRGRALARLAGHDRDAALRDLEEALLHEPADDAEAAGDQVLRGRLLYDARRFAEALAACDAALKTVPDAAEAHRLRVEALLELKRYDEVIASCDAVLARGGPTADLLRVRGLAKEGRGDLAGAIEDYTRALALRPGLAALRVRRGWAYLLDGAGNPALRDFDEAIRLDPTADAYGGRGLARALLGRYRDAAADAEESLRHGGPTPRQLYNAARIHAQVAAAAAAEAPRLGLERLKDADDHHGRARELLRRALDRLPAAERPAFWRDVVQADPAFVAIRRRPEFARLALPSAGASR
jgi:eukaryotic-like serine/threonine-protein kinase